MCHEYTLGQSSTVNSSEIPAVPAIHIDDLLSSIFNNNTDVPVFPIPIIVTPDTRTSIIESTSTSNQLISSAASETTTVKNELIPLNVNNGNKDSFEYQLAQVNGILIIKFLQLCIIVLPLISGNSISTTG